MLRVPWAVHEIIAAPSFVLFHKQDHNAGSLRDPSGHMSGSLPSSVMLCLDHSDEELPCSDWHWHLFQMEKSSFLLAEQTHPLWGYPLTWRDSPGQWEISQAHPKLTPLSYAALGLLQVLGAGAAREGVGICLWAPKNAGTA